MDNKIERYKNPYNPGTKEFNQFEREWVQKLKKGPKDIEVFTAQRELDAEEELRKIKSAKKAREYKAMRDGETY